jgi:hypothetical protein
MLVFIDNLLKKIVLPVKTCDYLTSICSLLTAHFKILRFVMFWMTMLSDYAELSFAVLSWLKLG